MVINNESIVWTKIICVIVVFRCLPYIADTKPAKPAIKSSTLPRTASQGKHKNTHLFTHVAKKKKMATILLGILFAVLLLSYVLQSTHRDTI